MTVAKILIVKKEKENLDSLTLALSDENPDWVILTAKNEKQCKKELLDALKISEPVDVVLTDLVMEKEDSGMSVLSIARELDPLVMSILFTAKEKSLDRYAAFDFGAFDVVEKNIRGKSAVKEINIKTRAAVQYRQWSQRINFLQKYFDPKVFNAIETDPSILDLASKTITIVFWDIRGFSRLCESLKAHPTLISGFLQEYCEIGARTIFKHNGILDKFIGDGVMALFGVLNQENSDKECGVIEAVNAAKDFCDEFEKLVKKWDEQWQLYVPDKIEIGIGCGIHTGDALVGNVGTNFRDQFTALGPHVNFAARIEGRSGASQILLSQSSEVRARKKFKLSEVDVIDDIKNIPGKFKIFAIN